jgi:hypothetical protein
MHLYINIRVEKKKSVRESFTGDEENFWNNAFEDTKSNLVVKGFSDDY